jgi:hypothetical protein
MKEWVFAFKTTKLSWNQPKARPWEIADGEGGIEFKSVVKHVDYDKPTKIVKVTEYLVKWTGQSYKDSTWESEEDIRGPRLDAGSKVCE